VQYGDICAALHWPKQRYEARNPKALTNDPLAVREELNRLCGDGCRLLTSKDCQIGGDRRTRVEGFRTNTGIASCHLADLGPLSGGA
jgi:hypothetical protein